LVRYNIRKGNYDMIGDTHCDEQLLLPYSGIKN